MSVISPPKASDYLASREHYLIASHRYRLFEKSLREKLGATSDAEMEEAFLDPQTRSRFRAEIQAYSELGLPNGSMNKTLFAAIGRLLEVPVLAGEVRLTRPVVMYEFEDGALERLSPAQKQVIRMGPINTQRLQRKLSEISRALRVALETN